MQHSSRFKASAFPFRISGLDRFSFLPAHLLACVRLKLPVTRLPPTLGYGLVVSLCPTGFAPALCNDLAQPHEPSRSAFVLNHTSGLETIINSKDLYFEIMKENGVSILEKTLNYIRKKEARFKPEEKFYYSNSGYVILGAVIEKISGLTYAQFIKENILIPLDMSSSGYDTNEYDSSWAVPCKRISYNPDVVALAPWVNREIPNGAGGLYSTVYDIYKWHKALNEKLLISEETRRMMETPSNPLMGAGYGVFSVEVFINGKYPR